jgi:WD40 repeat protein
MSLGQTHREVSFLVRQCAYSGHSDVVCDVAWSPHGSLIASASQDQTVQVWEA